VIAQINIILFMSKIVSVKRVANSGLQGELVDVVNTSERTNVLAKLNLGDQRFDLGSTRRAWFPVTLESLKELGVSKKDLEAINELEEKGKYEFVFESPKIDGEELRIQLTESIIPNAYQRENTMRTAKQIAITPELAKNKNVKTAYKLEDFVGQIAYSLDENGNYIFSTSTIVLASQIKHTFIKGHLVPETKLADYGATLAEPVRVDQVFEEQN